MREVLPQAPARACLRRTRLGQHGGWILSLLYLFKQSQQGLAFDQARAPDAQGGEGIHEHLGGAWLQLKDSLNIPPLEVGQARGGQGPADLVKTWEPGQGAGYRRPRGGSTRAESRAWSYFSVLRQRRE